MRGQFKASLFAFAMGISINFGRIYRLIVSKGEKYGDFLASFRAFVLQILTLMEPAQISALKIKKQTNFQISYLSVLYRGLKMWRLIRPHSKMQIMAFCTGLIPLLFDQQFSMVKCSQHQRKNAAGACLSKVSFANWVLSNSTLRWTACLQKRECPGAWN